MQAESQLVYCGVLGLLLVPGLDRPGLIVAMVM
jgi:hypothetical protein